VARGWPIQSDRRKPDLNPNTQGPNTQGPTREAQRARILSLVDHLGGEACRCFCCFPTQLSAIGIRPSAEILGLRQWLERKNSQMFAVLLLSPGRSCENTNVPNVTLRRSKVVWRDPLSCKLSQEFSVVNLTISIYVSVRRISRVAQNHNI
jgi:hypothetical protein